ncbi:nuclear transport factor 2 family protein [Polaribacter vadi]|uniref:nuclear transport factor 2 family protein n=1 Tax=Polaribacter TaxID=52959 RepID=UPI001C097B1C|nr:MULTISPECIES: nuclear transport factor 2 family protein [Polaribacter]MBU3012949.1 nuclear transport factor 2 family protein [Polaribacter vadi]MDO6742767.1 nuclear transport factor 2 family protein [Polaribacter sp. 1_MG-2023]
MKKLILLFLLISTLITAQTNTEIHLFDIEISGESYKLTNGKNISNNKGYDSQPYFYNDNLVLFASARNGQTDIAKYNVRDQEISYINNTENGGEYSPQKIPNSKNVSAVRLDNDGLQRFYTYNFKTGKDKELLPNLKVAYPFWLNKNTLIASVIVNDSLHLIASNLKNKTNTTVAKMVGRSIHKIPNSNLVSFISKENKEYWLLKSLNPETQVIKTICSLGKSEDVTWLTNGTLLISKGNSIYKFNPQKDKNLSLFFNFTDENINNISRIAVNTTSTKLAIVAEVSPEYLAEEQLQGYNKRDIDAFLKPYAKNVKVFNFPNKINYVGVEKMRENYASFFKNTPDLHCEILKRIVYKDKVIDHELVTANGRTFKAVAIYTMKNGKITSVTFM